MSKIIKARFLLTEDRYHQPMSRAVLHPAATDIGQGTNELTVKTAEEIFSETKMMMEEIVQEAQEEADNILLSARAQAQKLLEDAEAEADNLKEKAAREGFENGIMQGTQESQEKASMVLEQTAGLLEKLEKERVDILGKSEGVVLDLTFSLTEKVLGAALDIRPEIISGIIKKALSEVKDAEKVIVKVNPIHLPYLGISGEKISEKQGYLQFSEDTSLNPGDCVIVTENGYVEYKIDEQLTVLREALLEVTNDA